VEGLEPISTYVAPGTSRVVRVEWPSRELAADRLVLSGDDHEFDNTLYLIPPRQERVRVLYVGDEAADDVQGLRYFLESAAPTTAVREVEFLARGSQDAIAAADLLDTRLVVATAKVSESQSAPLRQYLEQGGLLLYVMKDAAAAEGVARLMKLDALPAEEAPVGDYALLGQIDFEHPLFAPFADPRFSDFTKIRFWRHRKVTLPLTPSPSPARGEGSEEVARGEGSSGIHVLARFDQGDAFLFQQSIGKGRLLVATSGWHPSDSQLALSTKFVPLVAGLLARPQAGYEVAQHTVYEPIELPPVAESGPRQMLGPDGNKLEVPESAAVFTAADSPGIYRLSFAGREMPLAVNLEADESRTAPFPVEDLESRGVRLGTQPTQKELAQRQRQLRLIELENRQKLWRWLIVAVLAVLVLETALAGRLAHRTVAQQVT
jgi:hypothetical protein